MFLQDHTTRDTRGGAHPGKRARRDGGSGSMISQFSVQVYVQLVSSSHVNPSIFVRVCNSSRGQHFYASTGNRSRPTRDATQPHDTTSLFVFAASHGGARHTCAGAGPLCSLARPHVMLHHASSTWSRESHCFPPGSSPGPSWVSRSRVAPLSRGFSATILADIDSSAWATRSSGT